MSTQRVKDFLLQAEFLTDDEKLFLAQRLLEQAQKGNSVSPNSKPQSGEVTRRQQQLDWIKAHQAQYADQYVALIGEQLVGYGSTYKQAAEAAKSAGVTDPFIVYVPDPNKEYFAGW